MLLFYTILDEKGTILLLYCSSGILLSIIYHFSIHILDAVKECVVVYYESSPLFSDLKNGVQFPVEYKWYKRYDIFIFVSL